MLTELHIKNFTIIEESHIELNPNMTVLTGETGAGKSILIDALGLALGNRADTGWIRHGCEQAEITASFVINANSAAALWCQHNDINHDIAEPLIIRRMINENGRTKASINGLPVTVQQLRSLGQTLVHIHSQNEHHALLSTATQLNRLDYYAKHTDLLNQVKNAYQHWKNAQTAYQNALDAQQSSSAEQELLAYQVAELDALNLAEHEAAELIQQHQQLSHASELIEQTGLSLDILRESTEQSIISMLNTVNDKLTDAAQIDPKLQNIVNMLSEAQINIDEAANELSHYQDTVSIDPEQLQHIESRLNQLNTLAHKHRVKPEDLYQIHQALSQKLSALDQSDADLAKLEKAIHIAKSDYQTLANQLTQSRQKAAQALGPKITQTMQALGMEGGIFEIKLIAHQDDTPTALGAEQCEFHVSTNPGQPLKSMQSVVSGGELSRISLAIQVLTAAQSPTPTLIFDEVDVGIGGSTAEIVGQLLRELGAHCQVLCVTHLPQVAACGHHHIRIHKTKTSEQTQTHLSILDNDNRIQEIARMLGGVKIQDETIQHAKVMLKQ